MIATRYLPALAVVAAFTLAAILLRPAPPAPLQHSICLELPRSSMSSALEVVRRDVEGCVMEYDARVPGELEMLVRLVLEPDGAIHAHTFAGPDHSSLRMCVEEALQRMPVVSEDMLWVDLFVYWKRGVLELAPTITKRVRGTAHGDDESVGQGSASMVY